MPKGSNSCTRTTPRLTPANWHTTSPPPQLSLEQRNWRATPYWPGERALASRAYEDARAHFERGLDARDIPQSGTEAASDEEAAALLFGLAQAQSATFEGHQFGEAFAILSRAFEYYAEAGNVVLVVPAAALPIAVLRFRIPGTAQLIARALTLVPVDSHEAGRLHSRYGGVLGVSEGD